MSNTNDRRTYKLSTSGDLLENLLSYLGDFGRYQCFQSILYLMASLTAGLHMFSYLITAAVPEHRCRVPWLENGTTLPWDSEAITSAIPKEEDGSLSSCLLFKPGTNITTTCDSWVYNTTYYTYTRAMQWGMVCENTWMGTMTISFYMTGVFVGSLLCGSLSDKYGRKSVFCWCALLQLIFGVGIAFINNYTAYLVFQFFYGFVGSAGAFVSGYVMIMELYGAKLRTAGGVIYQALFAVGVMVVALWTTVSTHATTFQLITGAHGLLILGQYWWMDESIRWLWSHGRITESVDIVARGVRMNGGPKLDKAYFITKGNVQAADEEEPSVGLSVLFKTPRMRMKTIIITYCWFANALAYYGISLGASKMEGNPFLNMFIMATVELPSYAICIPLLEKVGRRSLSSTLMLLGGGVCALTIIIPEDMITLRSIVFFTGKFCVAGSAATIVNFGAELFPTVARNTGVGLGSTVAGLGGLIAPSFSLLDMFDPRLQIICFSSLVMLAGFLSMFLPETLNQPMPQTIEDGEIFGVGDTIFTSGCLPKRRNKEYVVANTA